jgi:hypothetical protein
LTYELLNGITLENGAGIFGDSYESLMEASRVDLKKLTLKEVHEVIHQSTSLYDAAARLGVKPETLASHLGKFTYQNSPLTYELLNGITLGNGAGIFGDSYESLLKASRVDLKKLTLKENDAIALSMEGLAKGVDVEPMDTDTNSQMLDTESPRTSMKRKEMTLSTLFKQSDKRLKKAPAAGFDQSQPTIQNSP